MASGMYPSDPEHDQYDDGLISDDGMIQEDEIGEVYEPVESDGEGFEAEIIDATGDTVDDGDAGVGITTGDSNCAAILSLHDGEPSYSLALHPHRALVASAGGNDKAVVFQIEDTTHSGLQVSILAELAGHTDTVEHVRFSADGLWLATGSLDGTVRVYSTHGDEAFNLVHLLEGPSEVTWLKWHPSKAILAVGSADATIWVWSLAKVDRPQVWAGNAMTSTCGEFSRDGKILVTGGDGVVFVWNGQDSTPSLTYTGGTFPRESVISLALHPSQPIALAGFSEGSVAIVHLHSHRILAVFSLGDESVEHVDFVPSHPIMLAASLTGVLTILDSNSYKVRSTISHALMAGITCGTLFADGTTTAVGCLNGTVALWDVRNGEQRHLFPLSKHGSNEGKRGDSGNDSDSDNDNGNGNDSDNGNGNGIDSGSDDAVYDIVEIPSLKLLLASFEDGRVRIHRLV